MSSFRNSGSRAMTFQLMRPLAVIFLLFCKKKKDERERKRKRKEKKDHHRR
jgi:hypothetical protein